MLVKLEELEVGDIIIIGNGGDIHSAKILRKPHKSKKMNFKGEYPYVSTLCGISIVETQYQYQSYKGGITTYTVKSKDLTTNDEDFNKDVRIDLNHKRCWLIKKSNNI